MYRTCSADNPLNSLGDLKAKFRQPRTIVDNFNVFLVFHQCFFKFENSIIENFTLGLLALKLYT